MKIIFSDFDGTLTNDGKIGAIFFDILNLIESKKSKLVIVSGRSLSWGHFFITHFNLDYCLMEGGGVIIYRDQAGHICEENLITKEQIDHLEKMTQKLCIEIPGVIMSADSFGRRTDRAVEFAQMKDEDTDKMRNFLKRENLNFSQSNVHINFWIGDVSKARGVNYFLTNYASEIENDETCFFGDAANDESMFELFKNTIGVSNISEIIDQLKFKPKIVLTGPENAGAFGVHSFLKNNLK